MKRRFTQFELCRQVGHAHRHGPAESLWVGCAREPATPTAAGRPIHSGGNVYASGEGGPAAVGLVTENGNAAGVALRVGARADVGTSPAWRRARRGVA